MTGSMSKRETHQEMCCPTCHARQAWSDQCRRCQSDLSLLRRLWRASQAERQQCLRQLRAARPDRAIRHARRYAALVGAPKAARLLAVCNLLCENWSGALAAGALGAEVPENPGA